MTQVTHRTRVSGQAALIAAIVAGEASIYAMAVDTESPKKADARDELHFPPGPGVNLLTSVLKQKRWVDPIAHFTHLAAAYGDIAHYKLGRRSILFLNNPEYIREVFIVQHANFVKERTQQRAKLLLGEGMITAGGAHAQAAAANRGSGVSPAEDRGPCG